MGENGGLFLNPAAEGVTLSFAAAAAAAQRVRVVWQGTRQAVAGANELNIATDKIPAGAYAVRVYLRGGVISERLLVIK